MTRMQPVTLPHDRMPEITLSEEFRRCISAGSNEYYQIELSAHGVSVTRNLDLNDLTTLRDWFQAAIDAAEQVEAAA